MSEVAHRILVVEDQRLIASDIENTLKKLGYVVVGNVSSDQMAPPTINVNNVDEEARRFRLVVGKGAPSSINYAMTNSFGFGGTNASLIFRKPESVNPSSGPHQL